MGASPPWFIQCKEYHNHSYTVFFLKKKVELTVGLLLIGGIIVEFYKFIISSLFKMSTRSIISYN